MSASTRRRAQTILKPGTWTTQGHRQVVLGPSQLLSAWHL